MAVAIGTSRRFEIESHVDEDISVVFDFLSMEDSTRKKDESGTNSLYRVIRQSIKSVRGFTNSETGEPFEDKDITDSVQRNIFQWIVQNDDEMHADILEAYQGVIPKKLERGVKPAELGTGIQDSATDAS